MREPPGRPGPEDVHLYASVQSAGPNAERITQQPKSAGRVAIVSPEKRYDLQKGSRSLLVVLILPGHSPAESNKGGLTMPIHSAGPAEGLPEGFPGGRCGQGAPRRRLLRFRFDGQEMLALAGETVAAALIAAGRRTFRQTGRRGEPRGLFCGMGVCFDCLVQVDGHANLRACQTPVAEGMHVETQRGAGTWCDP
jgi:hypothetical protein